eukprot:14223235-Heterocapsa_arctica.AAC.1
MTSVPAIAGKGIVHSPKSALDSSPGQQAHVISSRMPMSKMNITAVCIRLPFLVGVLLVMVSDASV